MSNWQDLVTTSLIGTERAVLPRIEIPGLSPADDLDGSRDPAAVLLDRAALLTAARRAGRMPSRAEPPAPAEPDPGPAVSLAAGRRLARMLAGDHQDLLAEWLAAAAARGLRAPPPLLPALLDWAVRRPGTPRLRRLVAEVGGSRARWLAGLNPDWQFVLAGTPGEDTWRLGTAAERRRYLAALRACDPGAARELIAASWGSAGPAERVAFLSVLVERLDGPDEPLLEAALDDRTEEVRDQAAFVLARLPGSAYGARMSRRAAGWARMTDGTPGPRLVVVPQAESDPSMWRDGLPRGAEGPGSKPFLLEMVARTPLRTWTEEFGLPASRIVTVPAGDWAQALFHGWCLAAIAQGDQEWMAALIGRLLTGTLTTQLEVTMLRELVRRADPALGAPGGPDEPPRPGPDASAAVRDAIRVLRFRYEMLKELADDHGDG